MYVKDKAAEKDMNQNADDAGVRPSLEIQVKQKWTKKVTNIIKYICYKASKTHWKNDLA